ncbi:histidine kinase [Actinomadura sp. NPDC047616]|uniref:sensor histidine kinase n=1 Tax=Actinomadura sp. NPDC047616 TaxID=3155914 RepID=UPI0033D8A9B6
MVIVLAVLAGVAFDPLHPLPGVPGIAMLVLQLVHCLPRLRRLRGPWTLAAQAVLFPWAGPGAAGMLASSVLLLIARPVRWAAFAGVLAAAGLLNRDDAYTCANAVVNALAQGLIIFGVTRLSDLRAELHATRGEPAAESVARERDRASRSLDAALGTALSTIIGAATRGETAGIPALAREAAARARATPNPPEEPPHGDLTPRLALPILIAAHAGFLVVSVIYLRSVRPPAPLLAASVAAVLAVCGLQLYHSLPRPPGALPRHAAWTLPSQIVLACLPLFAPGRPYPQLAGFAAGSILIVLYGRGGRVAWPAFGAVLLGVFAVLAVRGEPLALNAYWTFNAAAIAAMFYGLALLTGLVYQVREARLALAEIAVARERRRIARDVHDLLGYGLSAIAVKGELAARAPDRAERELADIARIARRALADLRAIPGADDHDLSLEAELESARDVLAAAGMEVTVEARLGPPLPRATDALLATVLREAVTNVLRHSRPSRCAITADRVDEYVRLRVVNDGAPADGDTNGDTDGDTDGDTGGGQGLGNLTARVSAAGGRLDAGPAGDGRYELRVLQPAGLGGDADGVEAVPRV